MPDHSAEPAMSQKIFSLNLNVETVSLYLLCCAIADAGAPITVDSLMDKWNGDQDSLERELSVLEQKNIIRNTQAAVENAPIYQMLDEDQWS